MVGFIINLLLFFTFLRLEDRFGIHEPLLPDRTWTLALGFSLGEALYWALLGAIGGFILDRGWGRRPSMSLSFGIAGVVVLTMLFWQTEWSNLFVIGGWLIGILANRRSDAVLGTKRAELAAPPQQTA